MIFTESYKIDSIEDGIAAVETPEGAMLYLKASRLPQGAKAGDLLSLENGVFKVISAETAARKEEIFTALENTLTKKEEKPSERKPLI